jgi:pyruvate dehydrogenase E2 component (dihydrolipoamide acetyltransferase)
LYCHKLVPSLPLRPAILAAFTIAITGFLLIQIMAYEFKVPSLGDGVTGKVLEIMVKPGDEVTKDQIVLILGTDKVDAEMPVDTTGKVEEILVKKGDDVKEGDVLMRLQTSGNGVPAAPAAAPPVPATSVAETSSPAPSATEVAGTSQAAPPAAEAAGTAQPVSSPAPQGDASYTFPLPSLGDGVTGKVVEIMVKPGDQVTKDQIVMIIGTDKVDAEMPVDAAGTVEEVLVKKGDDVKEGQPLLRLSVPAGVPATSVAEPAKPQTPPAAAPTPPNVPATSVAEPAEKQPAPAGAPAAPSATEVAGTGLRASPLARKRAKELGINLADIKPAEGASRLSYRDVLDFVKKRIDEPATPAPGSGLAPKPKALPNFERFGAVERQPLSRIGQLVADNMTYAFNAIPHAWIADKADITKLEALRQQYKDQVKAKGGALTTTAILTKAVCSVLRKMPQFNTSLDAEKNEVVYKKFINIGIAVDTPRGLLVPVIRNADQKGLIDIAIELTELSTRTRDGKNKPDDLDGGTFTISNIGGIGGTNMISIVNWPQVAILSITAAQMEAFWNGTAFEPRLMMPMNIGWDHRVINGADAARFLQELKAVLEEPFLGWF